MTDSQSRTRILDTAEALFAERGFSATTVKDIGAEAAVNSALIYYYFENKETLYQACIDRFIAQLGDEAQRRIESAQTPDDIVRGVVAAQAAILLQRPHLPKLMVREMVDWEAAHAVHAIQDLSERIFRRLIAAIEAGQSAGEYRSDLAPHFAALSTIGQVAYFILARPVVGAVLGRGPHGVSDDDVRAFAVHAADFAISALRAGQTPARSPHDPNESSRSGLRDVTPASA
ncbi:MAG: TetR/AcrR family transcriptional regulator [Gemmatimonadaceae bacterium]